MLHPLALESPLFRFFTKSIRRKLALLVLAAVLSAVLVASIAAGIQQTSRLVDAKRAEAEAIAAALATTVAAAVADRRTREVARTLNAMSRIPDIVYVGVRNDKGRLVAEHGSGIVIVRPRPANSTGTRWFANLSATLSGSHLVETPIIHAGHQEGSLRLVADLSGLQGAFIDGLLAALLIGLVAAALGVGAAMMLQSAITSPIRDLRNAMQEIAESKDFTRAVPRKSDDEAGALVDSFNAMMVEIRDRDRTLARHRDTLEETVAERTRDLERARNEAEHANAAKSEFLSTMSHEIRTPMNGMLVMAELLAANGLPPRLQRYADVVVKSGQSLLTIINDILDFSKIEAGRLELESIPVAPRAILDDALQLFSERAMSQGLDLAGYVAPDVPETIAADPVRLNQVLTNLINNALKFTATGGVEVRISTSRASARQGTRASLSFTVCDTGIGIPADKLSTIFEAFSQADQSTTRRYGGTGIGLAICKRLADCMAGDITVESEPGRGTAFTLTAPFEVLAPAVLPPPMPGSGYTPLIAVEIAGELSQRCLAETFADWGFHVLAPDELQVDMNAELLIGDASWLEERIAAGDLAPALSHTPTIAVGQLGDTRSERLCAEGHAVLALDRPLTTEQMAAVAAAARQGRIGLEKLAGPARDIAETVARSFAGARILAADDSPVNREVLAEVLKRLDVSLTSVEDGAAAVEAAETGNFDLIFMDCRMPVLDGFEATRRIRASEREAGRAPVPVIALTAHVIGDQGARVEAAGMSDFITKPFALATIEACLERWLASSTDAAGEATDGDGTADGRVTTENHAIGPASQEPPLLDQSVIDGIREIDGSGDELLTRVVGLYLEHAPRAFARLEGLVQSGAAPGDCASAAHALKSLSRNAGAKLVGDLAGAMELQCEESGALPTPGRIDHLRQMLEQTNSALSALARREAA